MDEGVYLILGCYGRAENGFVFCPSVQNKILKIDEKLNNSDEIIKYLDHLKVFDKPLINNNTIRNAIYKLQNDYDQKIKRLWTDNQFTLIEQFLLMHKNCNCYLTSLMIQEEFVKNKEESIFIKSENSEQK